MRWYCVHPSLPLQAELRIRTAAESSAPEKYRISQGRAIAACSPVFQSPESADDATPASWLQVAYQDEASGDTEKGFMITALPDKTPLLIPWEVTDFYGCCKVKNLATLMFDGPENAARSIGAVQSVAFLYCMLEKSNTRVRIFHSELDNVWIDKTDVHVVCTKLKHENCSTAHAFYEINDELPEEAQIAIRELPSKEAQVVGLLSRDETLEVAVRNENWLQIVGGGLDKAWIMWRTDVLELLREVTDVCSSNCQRIAKGDGDSMDVESTANEAACVCTAASFYCDEKTALTGVPEVDHEFGVADDVRDMADEHPTITANNVPGIAVSVEPTEPSQPQEDCSIRPAQLAFIATIDNDIVGEAAALCADITEEVTDTSITEPVLDPQAKVVHTIQVLDDRPVHAARLTQNEVNAEDVDDVTAALGVHLNDIDAEKKQVDYFWCEQAIQTAQAILSEAGEGGSTDVGDTIDGTRSEKDGMKETENSETTDTFHSQNHQMNWPPSDASDPNDAVANVITHTISVKDAMIITDTNDIEAVGADSSRDDRRTGSVQNVPLGYSCSVNVVVSQTGCADSELDLPSRDHSIPITVKLDDEIAGNAESTANVLDTCFVNDIATETTKTVQNIESGDDRPIQSAPIDCGEPQISADTMDTGNGAYNFVAVEHADECVSRTKLESWDDRPIRPAKAQQDENGANGNATSYVDKAGPATKLDVEGAAERNLESEHIQQILNERSVRPAQADFDRAGDNDASGNPVIVAEPVVADAVNSTKDHADICDGRKGMTGPSHVAQSHGDQPFESSSAIVGETEVKGFVFGWDDDLCIRPTQIIHGEVDRNDGTDALLAIEKEAETNVIEHGQPCDQRLISPKRTGTAIVASVAGGHSENDAEEAVQLENDRSVRKDFVSLGSVSSVATSANLLVAVEIAGSSAIAGNTHSTNAGENETEDANQGQTTSFQDCGIALDGSTNASSDADIQRVLSQHNLQPMTSLNGFERRYAESEATSGSENGEIALLGSLEDAFEPVDEWLPTMEEEDNEGIRDGSLETTQDLLCSNGRVMIGERDEHSGIRKEFRGTCFVDEKPQIRDAVQPSGTSYLEEFGIRKYCERKQSLITPADELSLAMYEANQDDSDLVFKALVGDDLLNDDWFYDVSSRQFQACSYSFFNNVDLLGTGTKSLIDLIMSNANPEDILAAELSDDDDEEFDLVFSYKYPVPRRRVVETSRLPSSFRRMPSAPAELEAKALYAKSENRAEANVDMFSASQASNLRSDRISTTTFQKPASNAVTSSKTMLSNRNIGQPKTPTPSSDLVTAPSSTSKPRFLAQPRMLMQSLHGAPPARSTSSIFSTSASSPEASGSLFAAASTSSALSSAQSFLKRRSLASTPREVKTSGLAKNSTSLPKPAEVSGLAVSRKSFGFRYPLGSTKKT